MLTTPIRPFLSTLIQVPDSHAALSSSQWDWKALKRNGEIRIWVWGGDHSREHSEVCVLFPEEHSAHHARNILLISSPLSSQFDVKSNCTVLCCRLSDSFLFCISWSIFVVEHSLFSIFFLLLFSITSLDPFAVITLLPIFSYSLPPPLSPPPSLNLISISLLIVTLFPVTVGSGEPINTGIARYQVFGSSSFLLLSRALRSRQVQVCRMRRYCLAHMGWILDLKFLYCTHYWCSVVGWYYLTRL